MDIMICVRIIRLCHDIIGRSIRAVKQDRSALFQLPGIAMPPFSSAPVRLLALALIVVAAACSPQRRSGSTRPAPAALLVVNRSTHDVLVYLADGRTPLRLGRVAALGRSRLSLPIHAATAGARILVRSADSAGVFAADPVLAGAGGVLELTVQPILMQSTLGVLSFGR